jgi:methionine synthase II (cobalamin-independent)
MRILTTHVGSLPRTQKVVDFIFARERKEDYDEADFDAAMAEAVMDTVAKQKAAGCRYRFRWGNIENLLCHLCQGPVYGLRWGQPAQRPRT